MSCPICKSPTRPAVDAALASDSHASPRRISQLFPRFSRSQISRHRAWCLKGIPRLVWSLRSGTMTEEDARARLREEGNGEESVEHTLAIARGIIGGAA